MNPDQNRSGEQHSAANYEPPMLRRLGTVTAMTRAAFPAGKPPDGSGTKVSHADN